MTAGVIEYEEDRRLEGGGGDGSIGRRQKMEGLREMYDVYGEDMVVRYEEDEVEVRFSADNVPILGVDV